MSQKTSFLFFSIKSQESRTPPSLEPKDDPPTPAYNWRFLRPQIIDPPLVYIV